MACGVVALDNAVHSRAPRALAHARRPPLGQTPYKIGARARRERATLHRRKPSSGDLLNLTQGASKPGEVRIGERWQQRHQDDMRDVFDVAFRGRWQPRERLGLACPADAGRSFWYREDTAPGRRNRNSGDQRAALVAVRAPSAFDHETTIVEGPRADRRSLAAAHGSRQRASIALDAVQLGERTCDGKRELRPRPESDVGRQRAMNVNGRTATNIVMGEK